MLLEISSSDMKQGNSRQWAPVISPLGRYMLNTEYLMCDHTPDINILQHMNDTNSNYKSKYDFPAAILKYIHLILKTLNIREQSTSSSG